MLLLQLQLNTFISLFRRSWKSGINVCWCLGMQKWMNMEGYLIRMMAVTFILIRMLKIMKSMYDDAPFLTWHPLPPSLVNMMIAYYYYNTCLPDQISYMFLTWQGLWSTGQPWSCSPMVPLFFFLLKLIAYFKIASSSVLYWIICYAILLKKYFSFPLVSGTRLPLKLTLYVTRWEHWLLNNWYYYPCYHKRSCTIT